MILQRSRLLPWFHLTFCWLTLQLSAEVCKFPPYLRRPRPASAERHHPDDMEEHNPHQWTTEVRYGSSSKDGLHSSPTPVVQSQLDILVLEREIVASVRFKVDCPSTSSIRRSSSATSACYQTEVVYRRTCLSIDSDNEKFKVLHTEGLVTYTTCIKFVRRNLNVVQVFVGPRETGNAEDVCSDNVLVRPEWPWIATVQEEWSFCPLVGGFDFRAFANRNRERLCPNEWRPSRLEAECIHGDGLMITFPRRECSPLTGSLTEVQLNCWASWTEEGYWFIVAALSTARQPQYVLRFPVRLDEPTIRANWYFSPVCPTGKRGLPSGQNGGGSPVEFVELLLNKSEPGLCFDDSPQCVDYAREGKCTNSALYQYANFCKRSCGLCNLLPSPRPECRFPAEYHGEWSYFETDRSENVTITADYISFSSLGEFVCKSKHWNINYYKLFSVYLNGCRPRYTCLHIERDASERIRFQLSQSSTTDQSFDLCVFKEDPAPLSGRIHSTEMKTLLPWSKIKSNTCILDGIVNVFTHPDDERRACWGSLSNWNQRRCGSEARLRLQLYGQCAATDAARRSSWAITASHVTSAARSTTGQASSSSSAKSPGFLQQEYTCSSYAKLDSDLAILVTKSLAVDNQQSGTYLCWVIKSYYPERHPNTAAWREIYLLPASHCSNPHELDDKRLGANSLLALTTESDSVDRPCGQLTQQKVTGSLMTSSADNDYNNHHQMSLSDTHNNDAIESSIDSDSYNSRKDKYVADYSTGHNGVSTSHVVAVRAALLVTCSTLINVGLLLA